MGRLWYAKRMRAYLSSTITMLFVGIAAACGSDSAATPGTNTPDTATPATAGSPAATSGKAGAPATTTNSAGSPATSGMSTMAATGMMGMATTTAGTPASNTGSAGQPAASNAGATGAAGSAGAPAADGGMMATSMGMGTGSCCSDGDCLCRDEPPSELTDEDGPYTVESYEHQAGCIYYPTDAEPPFAAVAISDGFGGSGGCGRTQTDGWGPLYASHGIVAMIINTTGGDQPNVRGDKLGDGIAAFKAENENSESPLHMKLAGRYGTSGFSMGGGGTSYATQTDKTLLSSVAIMPWGPVRDGVETPTLVICGSSDTIASCASHGNGLYSGIGDSVPKMRIVVSSGHAGQPTAGGGDSGKYGLAFEKLFLEGDERWRPLLVAAESEETNIK